MPAYDGSPCRHFHGRPVLRSGQVDEGDGSPMRNRQPADHSRKRTVQSAGGGKNCSCGHGRLRSSKRRYREIRPDRGPESPTRKTGEPGPERSAGTSGWRFDANIAKAFQITETKSLQFRMDAFNVLNHPQPVGPQNSLNRSLSINPTLSTGAAVPWGQLTSKIGTRVFQGQLRLQF